MRKKVRRSMRDGLTAHVGSADGVGVFYDIYARNMRDLGSPMHAERFFDVLFATFPENALTVQIRLDDGVVGAAVAVWFGDVLTVICAHSLREHNRLFPNNLLYWTLFECAIERGCTVADFGRSPRGTGIHKFKLGWGMEECPLHYVRIPVRGEPETEDRREGSAYRAFSAVWRHTPMPVARFIGPRIFAKLPV